MISQLYMKNCALIEEMSFCPNEGLNIITGETGSGKSMVLEAIKLCLGGKYDRTFLRKGTQRGICEMTVCGLTDAMVEELDRLGIETEEDKIIITRELLEDGKSSAKINSRSVLISQLREIMSKAIDMHGQHQNQFLYDRDRHIEFLDSYAGESIANELGEYAICFNELEALKSELKALRGNKNEMELEREYDLLKFQVNEIEAAGLDADEYEELLKKRERMKNSELIFKSVSAAYEILKSADMNVEDMLGNAYSELTGAQKYDDEVKEIADTVEGAMYTLQDASVTLRNLRDSLEFEPYELEEVEERIDSINKLRRKYGDTIADIMIYLEKISKRIEDIDNLEELTKELEDKIKAHKDMMKSLGEKLGEKRRLAAERLTESLERELKSLNIKNIRFDVIFNDKKPDISGMDDVEFYISFNLGEDLKPIYKVASGGEMSRFMLAFKSITADTDGIDTMIFDEIDTGISGNAAVTVGAKMIEISSKKQILCVTHLPQIAAQGNTHFAIKKRTSDGRTFTDIEKLEREERKEEIARLISGNPSTEMALKNAEEMIEGFERNA